MTLEDFARIEKDLSVSLPPTYRAALLRPEFQNEDAGFLEFSGVPAEIISLNLEVWEEGFCGVPWPDNYLVIGEDGTGNNYFTDLNQERPAVYLADHELTIARKSLVIGETYDTFADFLAYLHRLHTEAAVAPGLEVQANEIPAKKPWWRFW